MFTFPRYKLPNEFQDQDAHKSIKICFHFVLGMKVEEVRSLEKIVKLVSISKVVLLDNLLQNYRYNVIRADNEAYEFIIVDFPLMSRNDLIPVEKIIKDLDITSDRQESLCDSLCSDRTS